MSDDRLTILLTDDEAHVRLIVKAYFAPYDVEILEARNGREALEVLRAHDIDLLVLDFTMPIMTGNEVLKQMSLDEKLDSIPVIVYTAGGFDSDMEKWLRKSSAAFLEKSNLGDELIPTVKEILGSRLKSKT